MTRKTVGKALRYLANWIDPQPKPTFKFFEPETTTTNGSGAYVYTVK